MVAAGDEGKRERELRGFDSPSYIGWGGVWRAGHEERVAMGGGGPGGDAARRGEGLAAAEGFAVVGSVMGGSGVAQGSFYRPSKAVELGGAWMEAGERCGAP